KAHLVRFRNRERNTFDRGLFGRHDPRCTHLRRIHGAAISGWTRDFDQDKSLSEFTHQAFGALQSIRITNRLYARFISANRGVVHRLVNRGTLATSAGYAERSHQMTTRADG